MTDLVYQYDRTLYSRSFFNCYQRQSMVILAEGRAHVHLLFYQCLVSSDDLLEQIIRDQRPKYNFDSGFFEADDLLSIGIRKEDHAVDSYADARELLLATVGRQGHVIPVVDVFYLPHCPEYRNQHVVHTVALREYDARAREWTLLDDNPASVLYAYTYSEDVIVAAYDNNTLRRVRYFTYEPYDERVATRVAEERFAELLEGYGDSYMLFEGIRDLLECRWAGPKGTIARLHDAISVYQGSRTCLLEYVRHTAGSADVEAAIGRCVHHAGRVASMLLIGKATGSVDAQTMAAACQELRRVDEEMVRDLRSSVPWRFAAGPRSG